MKKFLGIAALLLLATLLTSSPTTFAQSPTTTPSATTANSNTQATVTLTATKTVTPSLTATKPVATVTQTVAPSLTATKPAATATQTVAPSLTVTKPAATATQTVAPSLTATKPAATATQTVAPSLTTTKPAATATQTVAPSFTATKPAATATQTATQTVAPSATITRTQVTPTATVTKLTATPTKAVTATPTKTFTPVPTPTTLPRVAPRAARATALSTMFAVQNTDPSATASIAAKFYDTTGAEASTVNRTVSSYRSTVVDQRASDGGLGSFSSWQGSVVLSSNTPLAAVVNEFGGNAASGMSFRADSYNGVASSDASRTALLPQVLKNITDVAQQKTYNSLIAIQNTSSSVNANVTITYTNIYLGAPVDSVRTGIVIPPNASIFIDMQTEVPQWTQFFGPVRISADQNIAVVVNQNADGALLVYRGFRDTDGGNTIIVTQGLTNIFDTGQQLNYGSAVEGMVVDGSSIAVTVQFTNLLGGTSTCTFPAGNTFRVDLRYQYRHLQPCPPPLTADNRFFGSMTFTASKPIVALSNVQSDYSTVRGIRASTSRAFVATGTPGAMTAFAPLLMNNYYDAGTGATWGTALEAKFLSGTGTATITYYDIDSTSTWTDTYTAGADGIFRWDQRLVNPQTGFALPAGKRVSAVITAPNPFVFTVNNQATSATLGDALTVYMSR